jgi:integrase
VRRFAGPKVERLTVDALLDDVNLDYNLRNLRSYRTAKSHMARLREQLGSHRASTVTASVVRRYILTRRKDGAAAATIDRETEILRRAFNLAARNGRVSFTPHIPHTSKPNENARQGFLERADFDAILKGIADKDFCDLLEWLWWTGMRPGEIASLTWEGHDAQTGTLRLTAAGAKIGRGRAVPLEGPLAPIIKRRLARRDLACVYVFHTHGERMTRTTGGLLDRLYGAWNRACKATGHAGIIPYDLRRTAVRNLSAAGVPERVAMEITGHKTRAMFDRYRIVAEDDMRAAFETVAGYVAALPKTRQVVTLSSKVSSKGGK